MAMDYSDATRIEADSEKYGAAHVDDPKARQRSLDHDEEYSRAEQRKIIHRIDRRLVTTCGLMYCISLMDRTNLSAAAIAGMLKELKLTVGFRYSIIIIVFFITYVLCQPPATVLCRKIGPRPFLAAITVGWGATMVFSLCLYSISLLTMSDWIWLP